MSKYRVLTPVKAADGVIHKPNEVIELTDQEARNAISFKAVVPATETQQQDQPVTTAVNIQQQNTTESIQPVQNGPTQESNTEEDTVVPPESDVR